LWGRSEIERKNVGSVPLQERPALLVRWFVGSVEAARFLGGQLFSSPTIRMDATLVVSQTEKSSGRHALHELHHFCAQMLKTNLNSWI
jgi:hypothetical protein